MPRNIFLSFLGVTNYTPIRYFPAQQIGQATQPLRFVQEATLKFYCKHFTTDDKIIIFTTPTAFEKNWKDYEHFNPQTQSKSLEEGLEKRLLALQRLCKFENISIPEGKSEAEIWDIFNIAFSNINENARVIFDITHSFRSLPMLNMVLINYAKLLKNITVDGIYYGAFEAKIKNNAGEDCAPIWNLKAFSSIQDWTDNAGIFLKTGNAAPLAQQITTEPYKEIKNSLLRFSQFNLVNRGLDIYSGKEMVRLKEHLSMKIEDDDPAVSALLPILEKLKSEMQGYEKNSVYNGFGAIKWCIENGLLQQAATLMEEFITTFMMLEIGEIDIQDSSKRSVVSAALSVNNFNKFIFTKNYREWQEEYVPKIFNHKHKNELGKLANSIKNSIRNDINHAGFRENARSYQQFEASLKKRYCEIKQLIKQIKNIDLPELK
ncbi:MAG: TIGR02221 family CRISPR-associated protein [Chitinophagales bacterium]|nr:TIGR02221 family CRISPR-associated protein [Chitinophagales bacterium]